MDLSQSILVVAYVASGLLPLVLLYPVSRNRGNPGAVGMVVTIVGVSIWGFASAVHTAVASEGLAFVAWNVLLLGASLSIIGWFLVLSAFTGLVTPSRRVIGVLALEPLFVQVFAWTNSAHYLVYGPETSFTAVSSIVANYQLVFWIHAAVGYGLNTIAALLVLSEVLSTRGVRRTQSLALFGSLIPPTITNAVHLVVGTPFDLTPFGFVVMAFILGWALFRVQLMDVVPIGRERAVENMTDAAITVDSKGRVVDCNPAARELFGVGRDYVGMPGEQFFAAFPEAFQRFRDTTEIDTEISVTQNGIERHFDLEISPIHELAGKREGRLIVLREITLLKQREAELRERQQDLDLLRQVLSRVLRHNIRNDLTVVKGYNELFAAELDAEHSAMAETVLSKADDLATISEKARTVEKLIQRDQQPVALDLTAVVRDACSASQSRFPDVDVTVQTPEDCIVEAIPSIELAVGNLVENAAEHNDSSDPTVAVTLTDRDGEAHLSVSDNGPGVPKQELRLLEKGEETPLEHGSGLGLWIVGWVIRKSEASIGYDVGEVGTTVDVRIPK
ncbi:histidine kinase N-terminal 7TM domain-containing protein [Halorientalis salina]|uniref:histidine kinase N-terminal 7TM domain-containing protein n=1 Tax=Halorientalis salina TaxID=2932266 RepID=UPI0010ACFEC1|nr:histidine kinase N-terminal 7TM domain-containing protein [Halorientalis salina]